uniref:Uncharacterized protein n=1 Tax=Zea mays TaxID=4577 RepID=A0A804UDL0_MAIZE|eukprot:XP_020396516.1 uncharacterized protein LOC103632783 isoform X1 [Zea mays]
MEATVDGGRRGRESVRRPGRGVCAWTVYSKPKITSPCSHSHVQAHGEDKLHRWLRTAATPASKESDQRPSSWEIAAAGVEGSRHSPLGSRRVAAPFRSSFLVPTPSSHGRGIAPQVPAMSSRAASPTGEVSLAPAMTADAGTCRSPSSAGTHVIPFTASSANRPSAIPITLLACLAEVPDSIFMANHCIPRA